MSSLSNYLINILPLMEIEEGHVDAAFGSRGKIKRSWRGWTFIRSLIDYCIPQKEYLIFLGIMTNIIILI